jgi:hypothetical protein
MLSRDEFDFNLRFLEMLSNLNAFPFKVLKSEGKILQEPSKWRRGSWFALYFFTLIHGLHSATRLAQSLIFPQYFQIYNLAVHFLSVLMDFGIVYACFFLVIRWPEVTVRIFNEFFREKPGE